MKIILNDRALNLERSQTVELLDAADAVAAVTAGCLWVTMDGDQRDIVLRAGDRWTVERNGRTLIHAHVPSTVRLTMPRSRVAPSIRKRVMSAVQRRLDWMLAHPGAPRYY